MDGQVQLQAAARRVVSPATGANGRSVSGAWILGIRSALIENCVAFCEAAAITWAGFSPNCAENIDGAQRFGVVDPESASAYCGHRGNYRDWSGKFPEAAYHADAECRCS